MSAVSKSEKQYSKFDPRYIPGCTLWLDADDSTTITYSTGTNVQTWNDKSVSANNATSGTAKPIHPILVSGRKTILFDGPSSTYMSLDTSKLQTGTSPFSLFIISRITTNVAPGAASYIFSWGDFADTAANKGEYSVGYLYGGSPSASYLGATVTTTASFTAYDIATNVFNTLSMFSNQALTSTETNFVNGKAFTNSGARTYNIATTYGYIGSRAVAVGQATFGISGNIGEIIMFNRSILNLERQQVEGYLAWKWGLQASVPVNHPYYTTIKHGPVLTTYNPTLISGCVGWIDASDTTSFTLSGSTVSSITNKNGGGTIAISGSPTWTYNGLNGTYPAFGTNSGGFRLALASSLTNFTHTAFIVTSYSSTPTTAGTTPLAFATASGGSAVFFRVFDFLTGPPARYRTIAFFGTLYSSSATIGPAAANTPFLYSTSFTGTTPINAYYYAGTQTATITAASPSANASHCMIGLDGFTTTTYWQNGRIAEVLIFNRVLTDTERYNIDSYLSYKWGIQGNMPVSHPYKKYYPLKIN